jgi:hypothetical protein
LIIGILLHGELINGLQESQRGSRDTKREITKLGEKAKAVIPVLEFWLSTGC